MSKNLSVKDLGVNFLIVTGEFRLRVLLIILKVSPPSTELIMYQCRQGHMGVSERSHGVMEGVSTW